MLLTLANWQAGPKGKKRERYNNCGGSNCSSNSPPSSSFLPDMLGKFQLISLKTKRGTETHTSCSKNRLLLSRQFLSEILLLVLKKGPYSYFFLGYCMVFVFLYILKLICICRCFLILVICYSSKVVGERADNVVKCR